MSPGGIRLALLSCVLTTCLVACLALPSATQTGARSSTAGRRRIFERSLDPHGSVASDRVSLENSIWPAQTRAGASAYDQPEQKHDWVEGEVPVVDPPRRSAGYFLLSRTKDAHMFYFLFRSRSRDTDPLILWMTGGPGCASELAVFYENGPYSINKNMTLSETKYGWDKFHNIIYVDQPVNTGFSVSEDPADTVYYEDGVAEDMLDFLQEFFLVHPDLAARDLFITGESYAGKYVPAVAHRVWLENRKLTTASPTYIKLKGLAIGNGWTNPGIQFSAYADYALENNLIGQTMRDSLQWVFPLCRYLVQWCNGPNSWRAVCTTSTWLCNWSVYNPIMALNPDVNRYDITKKCKGGDLCYDFSAVKQFLNMPAVQDALGVVWHLPQRPTWETCSAKVASEMAGDEMRSYQDLLPELLSDSIHVMIYAGESDFICNWLGNARWVAALQWPLQQAWALAADLDWTATSGDKAGSVREVGPLSFVRVYNAGHLVPMDQPEHALEMITKFTRNISLADVDAAVAAPRGPVGAMKQDTAQALKAVLGRHHVRDVGRSAAS